MTDRKKRSFFHTRTLGIFCGVGLLVWWAATVWQLPSRRAQQYQELLLPSDTREAALDTDTERRIQAFCGDCHAVPRPESMPRDAWHERVLRGYQIYARSGRADLDPPTIQQTVAYYRARAPQELVFSPPVDTTTELRTSFVVDHRAFKPIGNLPPANSHLRWSLLAPHQSPVLLMCDMRYGGVAAIDLRDQQAKPQLIAQLNNPYHVEACDLDGDGATDLVVADAGTEFGVDHDLGRIVWLRRQETQDSHEQVVLASGLGRPTDIQAVDFDDDGNLDLLVADFGAYHTGSIQLLRNKGLALGRPHFEPVVLDTRPGAIHLPVHDFNRDGRPDFAALVTQEYEQVEVFINQGDGQFNVHRLWAAPDLTFGSSGLDLVDLDQVGDMDILFTNGDVLVSDYANPAHGVQWLENLGELQFAYHRLADMPGVYRALTGDLDRDGDPDIVAVAMFSRDVRPPQVAKGPFGSIVCLEQTSPGQFVRHTLETDFTHHATLEIDDFDNDGDLDFATGTFSVQERPLSHGLEIWWNQKIP